MKHKVFMSVIVLFCLLQAANLVMSLVNSGKGLTEVLVEKEETEKDSSEKQEPNGWFAILWQQSMEFDVLFINYPHSVLEVVPSKSFLSQPETPPPNPA